HEACAQVARGAANQVTSCSAPALRAWEGRALARPQSRGGAELPAAPFRTEGGAPTQNISEKPEPPVGAPAPGANASRRRRSCRQTRFAPRAVLLHITYRRSPSPL